MKMYGTVTAVDDVCDDGYLGVRIVAGADVIQVAIEDARLCCEEYGCDIYINDKECTLDELTHTLVGATVLSVAWDEKYVGRRRACDTAAVRITLCDGRIVHVMPWNDHNGYYCHTLRVAWHDYEDTQEL